MTKKEDNESEDSSDEDPSWEESETSIEALSQPITKSVLNTCKKSGHLGGEEGWCNES